MRQFINQIKCILKIPKNFSIIDFLIYKIKNKLELPFSKDKYFKIYKYYKLNQYTITADNIPVDIAICCIKKDVDILPYCINGLRKYINHKISNIYIIAPANDEIINICNELNLTFVNENKCIGIKKSDISYTVNKKDRSGWLFQQLLKLHVDKICTEQNIFVIDADTILTKPKTLISNNKTYFDFSDEYHIPYFKTINKLIDRIKPLPVSFVAHMMVFNKSVLEQMRNDVENCTKQNFISAIIKEIDTNENSFFSEFELYGNYFYTVKYKESALRYWFNISLKTDDLKSIEEVIKANNNVVNSISFHSYNN